jgi:hypothetical protein
MGFFIECNGGATITYSGESILIDAAQIKQVVARTELLADRSYKECDEQWQAVFAAQTPHGQVTWYVQYSQGDGAPSIDDVLLGSAPIGVVAESVPSFSFQESEE